MWPTQPLSKFVMKRISEKWRLLVSMWVLEANISRSLSWPPHSPEKKVPNFCQWDYEYNFNPVSNRDSNYSIIDAIVTIEDAVTYRKHCKKSSTVTSRSIRSPAPSAFSVNRALQQASIMDRHMTWCQVIRDIYTSRQHEGQLQRTDDRD